VSHDERIARVMAFVSLADDVAPGARRGLANVYAVFRRPPWHKSGSPWVRGRTVLVSHGLRGRPANGASYGPSLSGDSAHVPRCIVFISRATNLVAGDRGRHAQAFVEDLANGRITLVSRASGGQLANRDVAQVTVDGGCERVAFVSAATNLGTSPGQAAGRWPGAGASRPRAGTRQVYLRFIGGPSRVARTLTGLTLLASAAAGRAANADADQLSLSRDGSALAFVSAASNLAGPRDSAAQVWLTALSARSDGSRRAHVRVRTRLVSVSPGGQPGDAPSSSPSVDHDGRHVAFASLATNLTGARPGVSEIVRADLTSVAPSLWVVSESQAHLPPLPAPVPGNAPSYDPSISDGGDWVFFDSRATNLSVPGNGLITPQRAVYRWTVPALRTLADLSGIQAKSRSSTPAEHPDTSARGNYLAFESEDPFEDRSVLVGGPAWLRDEAAAIRGRELQHLLLPGLPAAQLQNLPGANGQLDPGEPTAPGDPRLHQVYVHYLGPQ
jgi:hypothetical protein